MERKKGENKMSHSSTSGALSQGMKKKQADKPAIVFLVAGQSNAGGCGIISREMHIQLEDYLPASREFLSAQGEAHSAHNSVLIMQSQGVNAVFVDLTGWKDTEQRT